MAKIRHSGFWMPRIYPYYGDVAPSDMDRFQDLRGAPTLPVDFLYEIGRKKKLGVHKRIPEVSLSGRSFEYGSLTMYKKLANKADPASGVADVVTLEDFSDAFFDIVGYEGSDEDTLNASILFPKCRLNGFGLNIGDPDAIIERTFDMNSDSKITWQYGNLYWVYKRDVVESGDLASGGAAEFIITDDDYPEPAQDPDTTKYFYRILKVRGAETTQLEATDWTYNPATKTIVINDCEIGDIIKFYYTAATWTVNQPYHQLNNDADPDALFAYCASIYLVDGLNSKYVYRLSSISLDGTFDRVDVKEIGNRETVETAIRNQTIRVVTTGLTSSYTFEEVLRGKSGLDYGKIDIEKFLDTLTLVVEIYKDSDKDLKPDNFAIGYRVEDLSVTSLDKGVPVNDFITKGATLESDNLTITTDKTKLWDF